MNHRIHYTNCPVCQGTHLSNVMNIKDHAVSGELFPVVECEQCHFKFTQDVPDPEHMDPYYHSDNYISHTNTSKGFINRLYQIVRKITLKQKRRLIMSLTGKGKGRLLDVGSGTGAFAAEMNLYGWEVTALEPDAGARQIAKEVNKMTLNDIREFYDLPDHSFDAITLWHVLEHVHDLNGYMEKFCSLLKPDGKLFIAVPNYDSSDAAIYKENWAAYDVPRHLYHFIPSVMKKLVEQHDMTVKKYLPMWFDSYYISMLSSRYKNGKTKMAGAILAGMRSNWKALFNKQKCSSVIYVIEKPQ